MLRVCHRLGLTLLISLGLVMTAQAQSQRSLLIFAAASLQPSLDAIIPLYRQEGRPAIKVSYAASSALARQIEQGAPVDLFISADQDWMDWVQQRHLIRPESRKNFLANALVLIAAKDDRLSLTIAPGFDLLGALGPSRLAVGDPQGVPAGKYAVAALTALGVIKDITPKLAAADNVRSALALVARGEARLGIVYRSDAVSEPRVRIVDTFPANSHVPIRYPIAITTVAQDSEAKALLAFLQSPVAQGIFKKNGFEVLP